MSELLCPKCGSDQVTANKKGFSGKKAVAGALLTGGVGILAGTIGSNSVKITCLSCGHEFKPGQGATSRADFRRKKQGCFITTATLVAGGKGDNCQELTQFRIYRDNWLAKQKYGRELIEEYYSIAPSIVSIINNLSNNKIVYKNIWDNYLKDCYAFIQEEKFEEARQLYTKMVLELKSEFINN